MPKSLSYNMWSQIYGFFSLMREKCENGLKTINSINMCKYPSHSLGDGERKILKDHGLIGRVRWKKHIKWDEEKKSRSMCVCVFFSLLREFHRQYSYNFGQKHKNLIMYQGSKTLSQFKTLLESKVMLINLFGWDYGMCDNQ